MFRIFRYQNNASRDAKHQGGHFSTPGQVVPPGSLCLAGFEVVFQLCLQRPSDHQLKSRRE